MSHQIPVLSEPDQQPPSGSASPRAAGRRRSSVVGLIELGDNTAPSLSTMHANPEAVRASRRRIRALSGNTEMLVPQASEEEEESASTTALDNTQDTALRPPKHKSGKSPRRQRKPKKISFAQTIWFTYRETAYQNSWFNPLIVLLVLTSLFFALSASNYNNFLQPFFTLSYPIPGTDPVQYGKGPKDFCFVFMGMLFFTFFREFWMQVILKPLAIYSGLQKKGKISRFMEQSYSIVYYGISGPFGLYIMYHSDLWYFNTYPFYANFPQRSHVALFKIYYLLQASFWAQQSVVLSLQLEKPRKDFYELVFHHIITMALIFLSYRFHFAGMGLCVYITMDVSDLFLALSKICNYLNSAVTGPLFIMFMSVWIYTRHYLNIRILYSIITEFATVGPFELNWETEQYKCWISQYITFALLLALQLVNLYWLFLIFRIAYRFVCDNVAKDERSDDEDEEDEEEVTNDSTSSESSIPASNDDKTK